MLLVKLAESLGLSPTELLKHLGPAFKTMLGGQGACCRCKATPQAEEGRPKTGGQAQSQAATGEQA